MYDYHLSNTFYHFGAPERVNPFRIRGKYYPLFVLLYYINLAMQFSFSGERTQDVDAFLASFEHHVVSIGPITDNEKFSLLVATFYGRAQD